MVRKRRPAFHLTTLAAICIAVAFFLVWLVFTREVNEQTARWTAQSIPADWAEWRRQWEYSHAIRFVLQSHCSLRARFFGALRDTERVFIGIRFWRVVIKLNCTVLPPHRVAVAISLREGAIMIHRKKLSEALLSALALSIVFC